MVFSILTSQAIFWFAALTGSTFFAIKILLLLFGACSHALHIGDTDVHHDVHVDHDADSSFKSFSLISLLGFMMMFGWVGLSAHVQHQFPIGPSIIIACIAGCITSLFCTALIKKVMMLANPGTVFHISDTVGSSAQVYQKIPAFGVGRIQIVLDGIIREIDATSEEGVEISSFTQVVVVRVVCNQTVSVKKIIS